MEKDGGRMLDPGHRATSPKFLTSYFCTSIPWQRSKLLPCWVFKMVDIEILILSSHIWLNNTVFFLVRLPDDLRNRVSLKAEPQNHSSCYAIPQIFLAPTFQAYGRISLPAPLWLDGTMEFTIRNTYSKSNPIYTDVFDHIESWYRSLSSRCNTYDFSILSSVFLFCPIYFKYWSWLTKFIFLPTEES